MNELLSDIKLRTLTVIYLGACIIIAVITVLYSTIRGFKELAQIPTYINPNTIIMVYLIIKINRSSNGIITSCFEDFARKIQIKNIRDMLFILIFTTGCSFVWIFGIHYGIWNDYNLPDVSTIPTETYDSVNTFLTSIRKGFIAPIYEELLFRGILFSRLSKKFGGGWGIVISSIIFGYGHDEPVHAIIFGILMCVLYINTQNILFSILVHIVNNSLVPLMLKYIWSFEYNLINCINYSLWFGIIIVIITLPYVVKIVKESWNKKSIIPGNY